MKQQLKNIEKNNKEFDIWLNETINIEAMDDYKTKHYIPKNIKLDFSNFIEFFDKREELLLNVLEKELL